MTTNQQTDLSAQYFYAARVRNNAIAAPTGISNYNGVWPSLIGSIDEIRCTYINRTEAWKTYEYQQMLDPVNNADIVLDEVYGEGRPY